MPSSICALLEPAEGFLLKCHATDLARRADAQCQAFVDSTLTNLAPFSRRCGTAAPAPPAGVRTQSTLPTFTD